jgi:hypothetical protein
MTDAHDADRALLDSVRRLYGCRDWGLTWAAVEALAVYWARLGRLEAAAVLLGHLQAHGLSHGMLLEQRRQTQQVLADTPDAHLWISRGARLDRDELIRYVLETQSHQEGWRG